MKCNHQNPPTLNIKMIEAKTKEGKNKLTVK